MPFGEQRKDPLFDSFNLNKLNLLTMLTPYGAICFVFFYGPEVVCQFQSMSNGLLVSVSYFMEFKFPIPAFCLRAENKLVYSFEKTASFSRSL